MRKSEVKASLYLLFLLLGAGMGLIAGGEIMRRILIPSGQLQADQSDVKKPGAEAADVTQDLNTSRKNAIVLATQSVAPCVVGIVVTQIQVVRPQYHNDEFFNFFFGSEIGPRYQKVESIGSGFVIREDGMILTNFHVVQNAAKLFVNFPDGRRFEGKVVGFDERADLAVISVMGEKFSSVRFGNSEDNLIGEWAIAIGNPFLNFINDAHPTVTVGVISARDRNFAPSEGVYYQNMIQTDAAINPGNSGGPLLNATGAVIGINTFIYTGSNNNRGSIGMGFAIPINRARKVADELIEFGKRRQVWTGIAVQDLNKTIALSLGYDRMEGVVVVSVQKDSPGESAGLKPGDVITRMGNRLIQSHADLDGFFLDYFVADSVKLGYSRKGTGLETSLILKELPGRY